MRALILAAGLGTRLGELTKHTPKPMVEVAGKPILEHLVEHLNTYGIRDIRVNVHYLPRVIMEHFGNRLDYWIEPQLLGVEGTMRSLKPWFREDLTVVMNGDTLTDINIYRLKELTDIYDSSIASYEGSIYTGTKLLHPRFTDERKVQIGCYWQDCGTPEGLKKARAHYGGKERV